MTIGRSVTAIWATFRPAQVCLFAAVLALAACEGGSDRGNQSVVYDGTTLVVNGIEYRRAATSSGDYAAGEVLVSPREGRSAEVEEMLSRYSLTVDRPMSGGFVVAVPRDFEAQWTQALASAPGVASADLNMRIVLTDPIPVVTYNGTTLFVDGIEYPRAAYTGGEFAAGRTTVAAREGKAAEMGEMLSRYSLTADRPVTESWVVVAVPIGFEVQWTQALAKEPSVASAELDGIMYTTSVEGLPAK